MKKKKAIILLMLLAFVVLLYISLTIITIINFSLKWYLVIIIELLSLILSIFLGIVLHEGGHCLFGLLTGYKLVMFRVGNILIMKKQNKTKISFERIQFPALGQCIMKPKKYNKNGKNPFYLYNLGGLIITYSLVLIGLLGLIFINNIYVKVGFSSLLIVNLYFGISNSIYQKNGFNDMTNQIRAVKDPNYKNAVMYQLEYTANILQGKRYSAKVSYPVYFKKPLDNITIPVVLYRFYYSIDKNDMNLAKRYYDILINQYHVVRFDPQKIVFLFEMLYGDIVLEKNMDKFKRHFSWFTDTMNFYIIYLGNEISGIYNIYKKINEGNDIDSEVNELLEYYEDGELDSNTFKYNLLKEKLKEMKEEA